MKPRQPGIETAKALLEAPRVPTPADKFWKMRGSPIALSAGSQARDLKLSLDTYGATTEPSHRPDERVFVLAQLGKPVFCLSKNLFAYFRLMSVILCPTI